MRVLLKSLKAIYDFFAGDAIILGFVAMSFVVTAVLSRFTHVPPAVLQAVFIGLIACGLVLTLGREARG